MPRDRVRFSPEVAGIVGKVIGDLSPEQAAIRANYQVGREAIRTLRTGKVGWESTVRSFAQHFEGRFLEHFGPEIEAMFGDTTSDSVSDWFATKCGFAWKFHLPPPPNPLDIEDVDIASFHGARDLPAEDIETANEMIRSYLAARRRARGLD